MTFLVFTDCTPPVLVALGENDVSFVTVTSWSQDLVPLETVKISARHMTGPATHHRVSFRAVSTLAHDARGFATMLCIVVVRFEAILAEVHTIEEAGNVGDSVKVTDALVFDQI